jgi:hypothetical protein
MAARRYSSQTRIMVASRYWTRLVPALAGLLVVLLVPGAADAQWYRTYDEGVQAAGKSDWKTVEAKMLASVDEAAKENVKTGRNVRTYGMRFVNFVPDYYLGLAYLNTGRAQQARDALQRVEQQKVLTTRDKEYAVLTQSLTQATATLSASSNAVAKSDPATAGPSPTGGRDAPGGGGAGAGPVGAAGAGTGSAGGASQQAQQQALGQQQQEPTSQAQDGVAQQVQQAARSQGDLDRLLKSAQASFAGRNYQEALSSARAARAVEPSNATATALVGQITRAMSDQFLADARSALGAGRLDDAASAATNARELGVDAPRADQLIREIDVERLLVGAAASRGAGQFAVARSSAAEARDKASVPGFAASARAVSRANDILALVSAEEEYAAAMDKSDGASAQAALGRLRQLDPKNARLTAYARAVSELVNGDVQRLALRQFFAGNYQQVVAMLTPLASRADAAPRTLFYLACSQAAILLSQGRIDADALKPAREQFNRVRAQLGTLAADRPFVSPRVLEALEAVTPTS